MQCEAEDPYADKAVCSKEHYVRCGGEAIWNIVLPFSTEPTALCARHMNEAN